MSGPGVIIDPFATTCRHTDLEVFAYSGKVDQCLDTMLIQEFLVSNARELEDLRCLVGTYRQ